MPTTPKTKFISPTAATAMKTEPHVLFVALGTHGHFTPGLHFAAALSLRGLHVTFATSASVRRRLPNLPSSPSLSFAFFSDAFDDGFRPGHDVSLFLSQFHRHASAALRHIILSARRPFTFVLYSLLTPWMADLARSFSLPSALFWNQAASVFAIYHHFFNGYRDPIRKIFSIPNGEIQLPGLPLLASNELPSLCDPASSSSLVFKLFEAHFQVLNREPHLKILINSFEELEHDALRAIPNVDLVPIGPVVQREISSDSGKSYMRWLDSKAKSSVVYVSFGSIAALSKAQLEEVAGGLLDSGRPFLWVMRRTASGAEEEALSCREELEARGKIVAWCSQVEILSNPAMGCFVTHCGWNSSLESIVCGVPVVAFPQWTDQGTNAKIIEELSESGMKLRANGDGIVERGEIKRCLDIVMGDGAEGESLRRNAEKSKELAKKAAEEGGSSHVNIGTFVDEVSNVAAL